MEGTMLFVNTSRATDSRSAVPTDSPEHLRILMQEQRENAHWRIYDDLVMILGEVVADLTNTDPPLLPRRFASNMREVDLSQLEGDGADPK
jgi:hypothetical protein